MKLPMGKVHPLTPPYLTRGLETQKAASGNPALEEGESELRTPSSRLRLLMFLPGKNQTAVGHPHLPLAGVTVHPHPFPRVQLFEGLPAQRQHPPLSVSKGTGLGCKPFVVPHPPAGEEQAARSPCCAVILSTVGNSTG